MDNAKIYRGQQLARIAASIGILVVHTPPYQPEGRGKIERYFRSVREQFLANLDRKQTLSLEDLNERLWAWIDNAYHRTEHSALGTTPLVRWQRDIEHIRQLPPATDLRRLFFHRLNRLVRRDCTFLLENRLLRSPAATGRRNRRSALRSARHHLCRSFFPGDIRRAWRDWSIPSSTARFLHRNQFHTAAPEPTGINFVELLHDQKDDDEE